MVSEPKKKCKGQGGRHLYSLRGEYYVCVYCGDAVRDGEPKMKSLEDILDDMADWYYTTQFDDNDKRDVAYTATAIRQWIREAIDTIRQDKDKSWNECLTEVKKRLGVSDDTQRT